MKIWIVTDHDSYEEYGVRYWSSYELAKADFDRPLERYMHRGLVEIVLDSQEDKSLEHK